LIANAYLLALIFGASNMNDIISNNTNNLIWVDLEMTGLNPDKDHILEMAIVITDYNLNIIANNFDVVIHQPVEHLMWMNDWVREVHTKNELLNLSANSNINVLSAEMLALEFISTYAAKQTSPMCGNSICSDRRFLFRYMPQLEAYFHYRNLDVSTVKNLGLYWFPERIKSFKKQDSFHRAKDDILQSIAELKFYRDNLFINK
jgi:oligoribonuclease